MTTSNINCISTREQFDKFQSRLDDLIREATQQGLLEPGADNEHVRQISEIAKLIADYEENTLNLLPLRKKNPLILSIEHYYFLHNLKRKEVANLLGITESVFSQVMNGKRKISLDLAKRLYEKLHIDPKVILENI